MAASYAQRVAEQVLADRGVKGDEEDLADLADLIAEGVERGYRLGSGLGS